MKSKTNKALKWSSILCDAIIVINILMFTVFLFFVIASLFSSQLIDGIGLTEGYKTTGIAKFKLNSNDTVPINDLSLGTKIWLLLRTLVFTTLILAIVLRIKKVISSITSLRTFYEGNIKHFQILAKLGLVYAFFTSFNLTLDSENLGLFFSFPVWPLAFTLTCLVLANVFKEGKSLLDDKNSII